MFKVIPFIIFFSCLLNYASYGQVSDTVSNKMDTLLLEKEIKENMGLSRPPIQVPDDAIIEIYESEKSTSPIVTFPIHSERDINYELICTRKDFTDEKGQYYLRLYIYCK